MILSGYTRWFGTAVICLSLVGLVSCGGNKDTRTSTTAVQKSNSQKKAAKAGKKKPGKKQVKKSGKLDHATLRKVRSEKRKVFNKFRKDDFYKGIEEKRMAVGDEYHKVFLKELEATAEGKKVAADYKQASIDLNSVKSVRGAGKKLSPEEKSKAKKDFTDANKRLMAAKKAANPLLKGNSALREAGKVRHNSLEKIEAEVSAFLLSKGHKKIVAEEKRILEGGSAKGKPGKKEKGKG